MYKGCRDLAEIILSDADRKIKVDLKKVCVCVCVCVCKV